jgi:hypothetical protein
VEHVQRPEVESAAGQVYTRRGSDFNPLGHAEGLSQEKVRG